MMFLAVLALVLGFGPTQPIFSDGFESGDLSAWVKSPCCWYRIELSSGIEFQVFAGPPIEPLREDASLLVASSRVLAEATPACHSKRLSATAGHCRLLRSVQWRRAKWPVLADLPVEDFPALHDWSPCPRWRSP